MRVMKLSATKIVTMAVLWLSFSVTAGAVEYKFENDKKLYITGYVSELLGLGLNGVDSYDAAAGQYQVDGNTEGLNQALTTFYLETQMMWGRDLEFRTAWRMQGDLVGNFRESRFWEESFGQADDNIDFDDSINDIIREFNVAYFSEYFNFRLGKQQLVWGEVDGLRIMDQINPLDLRRGFVFYDSDGGFADSRIPLWMVKTEFTSGMSFDYGGLTELGLELTWIPDVAPWNQFEIGPREGGIWAVPLPDGYYMGPGAGLRQLNAIYSTPDRTIDNSSFAARLKFNYLGAFITLNYFYGWSADGYAAPSPIPGVMGYGLNPWAGPTGNVGDDAGLVFDVLLKTYRQKTAGFTFSRQLGFFQPLMKLMGQFDQPVMRIEALYQFDKKYNISNPLLDLAGLPPGFNLALQPPFGPPSDYLMESDEIRWMMGLDWFALKIPWLNSKNKVTLSGQFINFHIMDHESTMYSAPYDWHLKEDFIAWSVLLGTAYYKEMIKPQIIYVRDATYNSWFIKPRVLFELGNAWRVELGAYIIDGGSPEQQFGLFKERDTVYTKLLYQF